MEQDEYEGMPLSKKIRHLAENAIAISPILRRFGWPGLVGFLLIGLGLWQEITWLTIVGGILAAPVIWCYAVIAFIFPAIFLFELFKPPSRHWED